VDAAQGVVGLPPIAFICWAWVAKSSANDLLRADSYGPPSLIAFAMSAWPRVTTVAASAWSSGSEVKRSDAGAVLIGAPPQETSTGNRGQRLWVANVCVV
jgi:hypothetical protein